MLPLYTSQRSISGFLLEDIFLLLSWGFFTVSVFLIPVIIAFRVLLLWTLRNPWARRALLIYFVLVSGLLTETFKWPHYLAPVMGLNYYFVLTAFRLTRCRDKRAGDFMLRLILLLAVVALLPSLHGNIKKNNASWHVQRARMLQQLEKEDGKHLIVVSYGHGHSVHDEWVYNQGRHRQRAGNLCSRDEQQTRLSTCRVFQIPSDMVTGRSRGSINTQIEALSGQSV